MSTLDSLEPLPDKLVAGSPLALCRSLCAHFVLPCCTMSCHHSSSWHTTASTRTAGAGCYRDRSFSNSCSVHNYTHCKFSLHVASSYSVSRVLRGPLVVSVCCSRGHRSNSSAARWQAEAVQLAGQRRPSSKQCCRSKQWSRREGSGRGVSWEHRGERGT